MRTFEYPRTLAPAPAFVRTRPGATTVVVLVVVVARLAYTSAYPGSSIVLTNATTTSTHAQAVPIGENGARARTVPPLTYAADDACDAMLARRRMRPRLMTMMMREATAWRARSDIRRVRTFGASVRFKFP